MPDEQRVLWFLLSQDVTIMETRQTERSRAVSPVFLSHARHCTLCATTRPSTWEKAGLQSRCAAMDEWVSCQLVKCKMAARPDELLFHSGGWHLVHKSLPRLVVRPTPTNTHSSCACEDCRCAVLPGSCIRGAANPLDKDPSRTSTSEEHPSTRPEQVLRCTPFRLGNPITRYCMALGAGGGPSKRRHFHILVAFAWKWLCLLACRGVIDDGKSCV